MESSLHSPRSMRLWLCLLLTLAVFSTASMRLNLSMAIVCMVNSTAYRTAELSSLLSQTNSHEDRCPQFDTDTVEATRSGYNGDLLWTPSMQSLLFSSTFYGAFITIAFSGYMADRFGAKMLLMVATMDYVLVTLATPFLARHSYWAFFAARIVMGIGEGFIFPCLASIVGRWFAPEEKSTVAAMYTSGNQLAAGVSSLIASSLCATSLGWPSIYYIYGAIGIVWCNIWYFLVTNSPFDNRFMGAEEKEFLRSKVPQQDKNKKAVKSIPWKSIMTSPPLIVAVLCQFIFHMQATTLQSFLPMYMKEQLRLPLSKNGLYTTVPFLTQLISKNILGVFADYLKRNGVLSHTASAKTFQIIGSVGSSCLLMALALVPDCEAPWRALPILAFYGIFFSCGICGFFTSVISLAPSLGGILGSMAMVFGMVGNLSGPLMMSLLQIVAPQHKWILLFSLCAILNITCGILFVLFGSADEQLWAKNLISPTIEDNEKEKMIGEDVEKVAEEAV